MIGGREPFGPFASVLETLRALRAKSISSVELLELYLGRIDRYNPTLRAIAVRDDQRARRCARESDAARARGREGPLLGLPMTIKDCIYVAGLPATGGLPERAAAISETDAAPVARLRAAGAVVMGTTNVPPYASDWQSSNPLFGRTVNPWDAERTPGGSSGGAAAAVAAGLTPLDFGGDFYGSIRVPAAFCGIYGHKPSRSALPGTGHFPAGLLPNPTEPFAVIGPLARTAEDLDLALGVAAGPEIGEDVAWRLELPPPRHTRLSEYRVAVLPPVPWLPIDDEISACLERLAERLQRSGATVERTQPEEFGDLRQYHSLFACIVQAVSSGRRATEERLADARGLRASGDEFHAAMAEGLELAAPDVLELYLQRERYRAAYRRFFRRWDVLLAPTFPVNAFPHDDRPENERYFQVDGARVPYDRGMVYPGLANLTGQPATAFPAGFTMAGLPVGLQAIGPYLEDRTTIRFAALVGQEMGGYARPPGFEED